MPLLVVATPIGNLDDLSPRAVEALRRASAIYCEDTRVTAKLASRFGLSSPRFSCHEHNETQRIPEVLRRLAAGETVVLVSDAGLPGLSDPGTAIVRAAAEQGLPVSVVPGPSAPATALAVSGLPSVPHLFLGFPPARHGERRRFFGRYADRPETLVWFEAPHRLTPSLADAAAALGPRRACLCRELTKVHEEIVYASLDELAARFAETRVLGEVTVVVEGARGKRQEAKEPGQTDTHLSAPRAPRPAFGSHQAELKNQIDALIKKGLSKKQIARELAQATGKPSREIYRLLHSK